MTLEANANEAQAAYELERAQLYRGDGSKLYADEEHRRREQVLLADRNRRLSEVQRDAEARIEAEEGELQNIANADPTAHMYSFELEKANAMRGLVADEVGALASSEDLAARLKSVLAGGDRASILVHWQAARRREHEVLEGLRAELRQRGRSESMAQTSTEVREVLEAMGQKLAPEDGQARVEATQRRLEEARAEKELAWSLKRGGTTPTRSYMNSTYGS